MADAAKRAEKHITQITECPICMSAFNDPRMLPCIHTFCFQCLKRTAEEAQKKPGDKMPCPLCRKEFTIPREGIDGLQKNFFMENLMENLLELKITVQSNDPTLKIGSEKVEEIKRIATVKFCTKHTQKPLDFYCADCKKIVCVSCFVESHKSHDCKDVSTVDEEFRQMIEKYAWKTSNHADDMLSLKKNAEVRKADFLKKLSENETAIIKRNQELKDMIDIHTKSLLDELSLIKSKNLKEMENKMEEIERCCTIFRSFEAYCTKLRLKGSASDICSSVDQLIVRADELEKDYEAFIGRPHQSVEVSFQATDLGDVLQKANRNFVGNVEETTTQFENCTVVVGLGENPLTRGKEVVKINLHRSNEISKQAKIPTGLWFESFAAVYNNTMYVTGAGYSGDEIWKYNTTFGWKKCASVSHWRHAPSAAFIDEVMYICGGSVSGDTIVLDSVEAYNAITDKCTTVGKLVHPVQRSGNCVPFKGSLYIFGGADKDYNEFNYVQVYNTKENTCTLLSRPMPHPYMLMRAVLWETSVILLGWETCFIFNLETETWQERKQFKTDVIRFGLALENERIFVIGGKETDKYGNEIWKWRDDVRYVPLPNILQDKPIEWKIHGKLPKPSHVFAYAKIRCLV